MPNNIDEAPRHDEKTGWSRLAKSYGRSEINPEHYPIEGQLLYAIRGVMLVESGQKRWVIPPQQALWLPPRQEHSLSLLSNTELRTIYFSPSFTSVCSNLTRSNDVHVIAATSLVKELIAGLFSAEYKEQASGQFQKLETESQNLRLTGSSSQRHTD